MILLRVITEENPWFEFDGWCASQGVNPVMLSWNRFLNLVYYYLVRNKDEKGRKALDSAVKKATAEWEMNNARRAKQRAGAGTLSRNSKGSGVGKTKGLPPVPPAWWGDGATSTVAANSMVLTQLSRGRAKRLWQHQSMWHLSRLNRTSKTL